MGTDENIEKTIEEFKKDKARYEAEKARLDAEKARHESQKALKQAETAAEVAELERQKALADAEKTLLESKEGLASTQKLVDLKNKKALADAEKELADSQKALELAQKPSTRELSVLEQQKKLAEAQKALTDAKSQATLAEYIGTVKAGPYQGNVEMKEKAGAVESKLLAAHAIKIAARRIATAVKEKSKKKVFIFEAENYPDFQGLHSFRFRMQLIKIGFEAAKISIPAEEILEGVPVPAAVSAGLEALSNILGYLKTDYTVGGIDITLDNSLLIFAVAGALAKNQEVQVNIPSIHNSVTTDKALTAFTEKFSQFEKMRKLAAEKAERLKDEIAGLKSDAADKEGDEKVKLLAQVDEKKATLTPLTDVIKSYDTFLSSLVTEDDDGNLLLTALVQEFAIEKALKDAGTDGAVLLLRLENSGGGYLLKKNLWTGLGAMPLYHMGGATIAYLLIDGSNGKVIDGSVLPVHGGFVKSGDIAGKLESSRP